ncbi:hypothetical protein V499_01785 [Pseudogymnoascus sp. VKM F-103]|nr:hypothetical protein V499_01785 [Pseudogymnoascus sp. VKM F-103]
MESTSNESRIILAIEALKNDPKLTERAAASIYNVPRTTLADRRARKLSRRDMTANGRKLTNLEENVLLNRIIDLIKRGFSPQLEDIQDMANCLLRRALAKDPEIIRAWFALVRNTIAKYGIVDSDIYNFDETGFNETRFLMGMLLHAKVVTTSNRRNRPRTKQPGNRE